MSQHGQTHLPNVSGGVPDADKSQGSEKPVEPGPDMDSDEFDARVYEVAARLAMAVRS